MPRRRFLQAKRRLFSWHTWRFLLVFWIGAVVIGCVALLLAHGSDEARDLFHRALGVSPYLALVITPAGFALIALLMRLFPGVEGSGIPQAIAALDARDKHVRGALLSMRIAIGKILLVLLGLACGASIGREGPTVHVGASIMDGMRRFIRTPDRDYRPNLILAGASAGLAAAFNTPLAGVVFAIEELSRSFEQRAAGTVMTAAILAGMTALGIQGKYYYFGTVTAEVDWLSGVVSVVVCGVVGGLFGGAFSALLVHGGRLLGPWRGRYPVRVAFACGVGVALVGLASGGATFGTGYDAARAMLSGQADVSVGYPFLKWLASLVSYWSGMPGGIFAPSLSVGAGLGYHLSPLLPSAPVAAVALLGMAAYFAGVVQTPLTAVIIIMEMTDDHPMLLPVMATALIANAVSRFISPHSVYSALAEDFLRALPAEPEKTSVEVESEQERKS